MLKCDGKVATTSGSVICKIQNMPWLKHDITVSTHAKSIRKTDSTMLKTLSQKDEEQRCVSEKKDKKKQGKSKKRSTDIPPGNDVKHRGNAKSKANGHTNHQAPKRDIAVPEMLQTRGEPHNAWNTPGNTATSLFPNSNSKVTRISEDAELQRVLEESLKTAFLEQFAVDPPQNEVKTSGQEPETEAEWGTVQSNLPTQEPEKDFQISDGNNNSALHPIENLRVPTVKLERGLRNPSSEDKYKKNYARRSEFQSNSEVPSVEAPLVPVIAPKYIDKFGRVDGCTEKRLFMGKGARFKEQEYLRQLLQQQQLKDSNPLLPESRILSFYGSDTSSDQSKASSENQNASSIDEAYGYSQDSTENVQDFNSQSDIIVDNSQHSSRSVDQFIDEMEAISNSSQYPAEGAIFSEKLSSEKNALPAKKFTSLCSGEETQNSKYEKHDSSRQTMTQSHKDFTRVGRPIVSGANFNNYQQKRHQSSGIPANSGDYHDRYDQNSINPRKYQGQYDRSSRPEENSGTTFVRGNRNKWGEQDHNYQNGPKGDHSPQKWDGEQRRDHGGLIGDRSSCKPEGGQKRNNVIQLTADAKPFIPAGRSIKNDNYNEYRSHSQIEKDPELSLQALNINALPKEESNAWPADVATNDSRRTFEKDVNETSSNISEIPDISNFGSRFSAPPAAQDFPMEMISIPPVISQPTNAFSVDAPLHYSEISNTDCLNKNLQYSPPRFSTPPGFQSLERPTMPLCVRCTPRLSLEAKYPNLLRTDPLLFRLLQQKQTAKMSAAMKLSKNPENSNENLGNPKIHESCPNCSCSSQFSKNVKQKTMNTNLETGNSEEEGRAQFQSWHSSNPPPINQYLRNPVATQHPETLEMGHVGNGELTAPNIRRPNILLPENLHLIPCYVDAGGNVFPMPNPIANSYQHVQRAINLPPRAEDFQGFLSSGFQNLPSDVPSLFDQNILANQYGNASGGYPPINAQQAPQMRMPFRPHNYDANIAPMSQSNVVQSSCDYYREAEHHQTLKSTRADMNNQKGKVESVKAFPSGRGAGKKTNFKPIPIEGRGRARLTQNN